MPVYLDTYSNALPRYLVDQSGSPVAFGGTGAQSGQFQGAGADGAATTGNPVLIGATDGAVTRSLRTAPAADTTTGTNLLGAGILGQFTSPLPTYTSGQFGTLAMNNRGLLQAMIVDGAGSPQFFSASGNGDAQSASAIGTFVGKSQNYIFNGSTWDRQRGDTSGLFVAGSIFWTESTTGLAANATLNGALRSNGGVAAGIGARHSFFIAEAFSDVAGGTLFIDKSVDGGTTWRQVGSIALAAATSVSLKVPVSAASYRARVTNGGTAQAAALVTTSYAPN